MTTNQTAQPATAPAANGAGFGSHASGSLYVGDLTPDVTEALLFEIFNAVGPVSSIRVCRDAASRRSLGYAYVNFHNVVDAERALDTLNFTLVKGKECRIMWSHRDPSIRKSSASNVFIKNMDKTIDNKALYDTFSQFGNILSCKVAMDGAESKGYGFIHFETEEAATTAIEKVNGKVMEGKQVYVGKFERRSERSNTGANKFTNVYVKNIPEEWDEAKLRETFEKFGVITSICLRSKEEGKNHSGFGFVNFETHEEAAKAVEEGSKIEAGEDRTLFVDRFQKKSERSSLLARKYEHEKNEKYKNLNLYVKNLEEDVDDEKLKEMFDTFGEISSAVVMKDAEKGTSRGFGFVCFAEAEDAEKALKELNGKMICSKPIYVSLAQRKEERRVQLEAKFQASMAGQRMQPMPPVFYAPPTNMPMPQPGLMYQQQMMNRRYPPPALRGGYPMFPQPMKRGGRSAHGAPRQPMNGRGQQHQQQQKYRYNANPRNHRDVGHPVAAVPMGPGAPMVVPQPIANPTQELTAMLANATPEVQKQMLGEKLYPMVQKAQPEQAGKITGMLLEMDVADILSLLESEADLQAKLQEAMEVLHSHEQVDEAVTA